MQLLKTDTPRTRVQNSHQPRKFSSLLKKGFNVSDDIKVPGIQWGIRPHHKDAWSLNKQAAWKGIMGPKKNCRWWARVPCHSDSKRKPGRDLTPNQYPLHSPENLQLIISKDLCFQTSADVKNTRLFSDALGSAASHIWDSKQDLDFDGKIVYM